MSIDESFLVRRVKPGDYVLCRLSAPLVKYCMSLISSGRKGTVKGRDFGKNLSSLVSRLGGELGSMDIFFQNLESYFKRETEKYIKQGRDTSILDDKKECIITLSKGAKTTRDVIAKIDAMFSDFDNPGVMFSTVHRAKGLEANRIFILYPHLMPFHKAKQDWQIRQEMNLKYVALTRAKEEMIFVHEGSKKSTSDNLFNFEEDSDD